MDSILHLVGIAKKAGRLEVGEEPVGAAAHPARSSRESSRAGRRIRFFMGKLLYMGLEGERW